MSYLIAGDGIGTWHVCCIMMTLMFLLWQKDSKTKIVSKLPMCHRSVDYELVVSKNYENTNTMKSLIQAHQIPKFIFFLSPLAAVFTQWIEARC